MKYCQESKLPIYMVHVPVCTKLASEPRPSWSWSCGSWIYNYLCNQYLSPLKLWIRTCLGEVYSIQHYVIKFVS